MNGWPLFAIVGGEALLVLMVIALIGWVIVPYVRLSRLRKRALDVTPQAQQIWVQEGDILYILDTNHTGVKCVSIHDGKSFTWWDSWPQWQQRLQNRVVWYTGQQRPLGPQDVD
jgi:hypothetical protein